MASTGLIVFIGIVTFFNLAIILHKLQKGKQINAVVDLAVLIALSIVFGGTISALAIAMVASMLFSLYLLTTNVEVVSSVKKKGKLL